MRSCFFSPCVPSTPKSWAMCDSSVIFIRFRSLRRSTCIGVPSGPVTTDGPGSDAGSGRSAITGGADGSSGTAFRSSSRTGREMAVSTGRRGVCPSSATPLVSPSVASGSRRRRPPLRRGADSVDSSGATSSPRASLYWIELCAWETCTPGHGERERGTSSDPTAARRPDSSERRSLQDAVAGAELRARGRWTSTSPTGEKDVIDRPPQCQEDLEPGCAPLDPHPWTPTPPEPEPSS